MDVGIELVGANVVQHKAHRSRWHPSTIVRVAALLWGGARIDPAQAREAGEVGIG